MPDFLVVAVVLVLLASAFVLFPVMMNRSSPEANRRGINITLFKDRLAELQAQQRSGDLDAEEFQRLKVELERRLLEEAEKAETAVLMSGSPLLVALSLALLIPIISYSVYHQTGARADWDITETLKQARYKAAAGQPTDTEIETLLQQLTTRLEQRPDNGHYLMLLGKTRMQLQHYPAAIDAFYRLSLLAPSDPSVLGQYAQALYLGADRNMTDDIMAVANRALAANPQQPTVLSMLGIASFEQKDYQAAINYWQRLLPALPEASPNRQMIQAGIAQAKTLLAASGVDVMAEAGPAADARAETGLKVEVVLADSINADANAIVFVFARALSGPKMPLAVARLKVSDLPASVTLDDSMAMAPGLTLSSFEQVEVVARISKNGIANRGPGDVEGRVGPITVTAGAPLSVIINQVLP